MNIGKSRSNIAEKYNKRVGFRIMLANPDIEEESLPDFILLNVRLKYLGKGWDIDEVSDPNEIRTLREHGRPARTDGDAAAVGVTAATRTNTGGQLPLPQDYADMLGWKDKADTVAAVVAMLTPEELRGTVLYGANYGQAGALDLYGRRVGLPPVVSFAGSFFFFGPGDRPGDVIVLLGVELQEVESLECGSLELAARVANPWGVEEERDVPVLVCRRPNTTVQDLWAHRAAEPNEQ